MTAVISVCYEKAEGQPGEALKYFTKCLEGVDAANTFTKLPHCLREVRPTTVYYLTRLWSCSS